MRVEYERLVNADRIYIHFWGAQWSLSISEARDLYTQLTPILEQVAKEREEETA